MLLHIVDHCYIGYIFCYLWNLVLGGYGVVFLVKDGHGKKFALKRFYVNDESRLQECKTEIEILVSCWRLERITK